MLGKHINLVREKQPLIHNITNYVTVNDVANIILAIGASPIMSDEPDDVGEITSICNGLNINIGTLNKRSIEAMFVAGKRAKELGHVVLLDPVGAGASALRTATALRILDEIHPDIIRGNISEIKTLALGQGSTKGVDADIADTVTDDSLDSAVAFAKAFSKKTGSVIAITGAIDLVSDANTCYVIRNGHPAMSKITGTGCQLSGLTCAFAAASIVTSPVDNNLDDASSFAMDSCDKSELTASVAAAVITMGLAGEIGYTHLAPYEGNSTYRNRIIDAIYHMDSETFEKGARYEIK